jgi:large subunit ribosomal protein L32
MPVPKYRTSASKRDMRRSHHKVVTPAMGYCSSCGATKQPHIVCKSCGTYKGVQYLEVKSKNEQWEGNEKPAN